MHSLVSYYEVNTFTITSHVKNSTASLSDALSVSLSSYKSSKVIVA